MTWPGWGDILPSIAMLTGFGGSVAGVCWALMRLFRPLAENVARDASDNLYERLKKNDFRHMEDSLQALGERLAGRMDGLDGRVDGLDGRVDGLDGRMDGLDGRMDGLNVRMDGLGKRMDRMEKRIGERFDRARQDRKEMEARLMQGHHESSRPRSSRRNRRNSVSPSMNTHSTPAIAAKSSRCSDVSASENPV